MGASTLISAVVCFLLATSMGGNSRSWSDPLVYGLLLASVSLSVAFCAIEKYVALNPIMPWSIISSRTPLACSLTNFFGIMCSFAMTYTTPLFFQGVLGYSSSQAGLFFLPKVASMSCGSLSSGFWMARTGEYRAFLLCTSLIACLAMIGSSLWTKDTPLPYIVACLMMDGFSSGAIVTTALVAMLSCVGSTGKEKSSKKKLYFNFIAKRNGYYHVRFIFVPLFRRCDRHLCHISHFPRLG